LGKKVILTIWHNISSADVESYSPTLAGVIAMKSNTGYISVAEKIIEAVISD